MFIGSGEHDKLPVAVAGFVEQVETGLLVQFYVEQHQFHRLILQVAECFADIGSDTAYG